MKTKSKKEKIGIILYIFVTLSFIIPIVFLSVRLISGRVSENDSGYHSSADYALMIVQCVLGIVVINLPSLLAKKFSFEIPMLLYSMYVIFLYCAIFLGEVRSFYYVIPFWDTILHAFSSLMLGFFGFMVITILNRNEHIVMELSPLFTALFAFCFALSVGSLWEIYEFTFDTALGFNMQKFMLADGTELSGHSAIVDTMKDLIIDALGALSSSVIGFIAVKNDKKWVYPNLTPKKVKNTIDEVRENEEQIV